MVAESYDVAAAEAVEIANTPPVSTRRVRVTVEGDAHYIGKNLRVVTPEGPTIVVGEDWAGVTVEDLAPEYVWTDADVVQWIGTDVTYTRRRMEGNTSRWFSGAPTLTIFGRTDTAISAAVRDGRARVLRRQAVDQ
ncbi:hypothetical protein SAMN05428985_11086 [Nocardioides sp. YR527]|uniref:hypothetical protein n=1 Tax=Nocardioides sp. YR527 TaxID=1881028 RepID=UPI0008880B54|nr:hypothetical protein [Nocardioides sp. YR527]SDL15412.1 hypothetical protein SAMN05428985_11086 [Nocardioides sp. YR527]